MTSPPWAAWRFSIDPAIADLEDITRMADGLTTAHDLLRRWLRYADQGGWKYDTDCWKDGVGYCGSCLVCATRSAVAPVQVTKEVRPC